MDNGILTTSEEQLMINSIFEQNLLLGEWQTEKNHIKFLVRKQRQSWILGMASALCLND